MENSLILYVALAYLLGAVPFGIVVARVMGGRDPRTAGSKNIGATNVGRTVGKAAGVITLLLDILKGVAPVLAVSASTKDPLAPALVGLAAFLGHLFPVYLGFRGGKGIATGAGIFLAASPATLGIAAVVFALTLWRTRMVSAGSILGCAALPIGALILREPPEIAALGVAVAVLSIWKHSENIKRIMAGTESRLGEKA